MVDRDLQIKREYFVTMMNDNGRVWFYKLSKKHGSDE